MIGIGVGIFILMKLDSNFSTFVGIFFVRLLLRSIVNISDESYKGVCVSELGYH